jgi:anti-sigma factor RsiW
LTHITEEDLERYAMRMAPEADLERIEEHLLICAECRDRLIETERVVAAFQAAGARIKDSKA